MPVEMSAHQLAEFLESNRPVFLLDVRQPHEHALAALPGSTLIPLSELPQRWHEMIIPAGTLIVAYCHHGVRSWHAALFLDQKGLAPVYSLQGGIDAWSLEIDPSVPRYA